MKALEILKHKWIAGNVIYDEDTDRHTRYLKYDDRLIEEAIKELEELIEKDKSKNCEESYDKTKLAIKALENRSCSNCKRVNSCKLASDVVDNFGTKLREQWFYCWEQK